jgi:hypothetical protein
MKRLLLIGCLATSAYAGQLDEMKVMGNDYNLVYVGVDDRMGKAYYLFGARGESEYIIAIPCDAGSDARACFQAANASIKYTQEIGMNQK